MRDIEKTNMTHEANARRIRRRKRGRSLYALLVVVLAFAVIVILSTTIFFNIQTIRVTGNADTYSAEEIVEAIGVSKGENMLRLHISELEEAASETLIDVEEITIKRQFPNTLIIDVQKSIPAYNISYAYGTLIVSEHGKILQDSMDPMEGLVSIYGYQPEETTPGKRICATEERYDKILTAFQELMQSGTLETPISSIDMSDFNDIIICFDNRIEFDMGNWSEIDYKISFAEQVIAMQPDTREGYLTMIGSNQCSFRSKSDVMNAEKAAEKKAAVQEAAETEQSSEEVAEIMDNPDYIENTTEQNGNIDELTE